tara:strand:+ start:52693 stop:53070 length:378 start_codon:yes stop_codon:yes gene_type:complete
MVKKSVVKTPVSLVDLVVKGMQEKKATQICVIDLTKVTNAYADFFIICSGSSNTNVQAIANGVEELTQTTMNEKPTHIEGYQEANWILLDYFDTMVHVFKEEERAHYNLEGLWADAKITHIADNE